MKVLIEIVHPADVLFFKKTIDALRERGETFLVLSRKKDIACELLEEFGIPYKSLSVAGRGLAGLAAELLKRDLATLREALKFNPDVMIGFGGVSISHVGALLGKPSVSFYDSENATLQTRITWPFITRLYVPDSYQGSVPVKKTTRVPGTKELSYLHPSHFIPDPERARRAGLDTDRENFFVRFVEWRANHDIGKEGVDMDTKRKIVEALAKRGRVHISSETAPPSEFDEYRYRGKYSDIHHLVGHCRLLVGESATMASEAATLGVPAIYAGRDFPGYTKELESVGLICNVHPDRRQELPMILEKILEMPMDDYRVRHREYLTGKPDWTVTILEALDRGAVHSVSGCTSK